MEQHKKTRIFCVDGDGDTRHHLLRRPIKYVYYENINKTLTSLFYSDSRLLTPGISRAGAAPVFYS